MPDIRSMLWDLIKAMGCGGTDTFLQDVKRGPSSLVEALRSACRTRSDEVIIKLLRESGVDLDARDKDGSTALMIAARAGDSVDVCRLLLQCGADVNARALNGATALHHAIARGHEQLCKLLIRSGADLGQAAVRDRRMGRDCGKPYFATPLEYAVLTRFVGMCPLLLQSGAPFQEGLFFDAVWRDRVDIVRALLPGLAGPHNSERSWVLERALVVTVEAGRESMCRLLLTEGHVQPNRLSDVGWLYVVKAVSKGQVAICRALLDAGFKPDYCPPIFSLTPLHETARKGNYQLCKLYLGQPGINVDVTTMDEERCTPLLTAACRGHAELVDLFIRSGASVHAKGAVSGASALHGAARSGCEASVKALIEAGAIATNPDRHGDTPLHAAAERGHAEVCIALIETGCVSVSARGKRGQTPLHRAANIGNVATVCVLIEANADVNARCAKGRTPLHVAAGYGSEETCRLLIKAGASVSEQDNAGYQPLHVAASRHRASNCKLLLENGADPRARTTDGLSIPLHLAAAASATSHKFLRTFVAQLLEACGPAVLEDVDGNGYNCLQLVIKARAAAGARCLLNSGGRFPAAVLAGGGAGAAARLEVEKEEGDNVVDTALGLDGPASCPHERWDRRLAHALQCEVAALLWGNSKLFEPGNRGFLRWAASLPREVLLGALRSWCGRHAVPRCISHPKWPKQREKLVSSLKDDAWQRRKALVTWYFGERRRRREGAGDDHKSPDAPPAVS